MHLDYAAVHKSKKGLRRWVIIGLSRWLVIEGQKVDRAKKLPAIFEKKSPFVKWKAMGPGNAEQMCNGAQL